ncbi:MAG: AraC family transcriptional regulator [Bacteroidales bacterium]|jgi:AraC-like DNA-binding protein|nr:AraC family transcriptional regulator [Bacteroidales bacterium]
MSVHFATPSQTLAPFIKRYWAIENVLGKGKVCVQRIIPTGLTELMLYFTPRPKILTESKYVSDNVALYGHQNDFYDMELTGNLSVFSIVFQPQGLMRFFNFPLREIFNRNVSLKDISGQAGRDLEEKMNEATTFRQRVYTAETYLSELLKNNCDDFEFSRINHIAELIKQTCGKITVNQLASAAYLSRKQFERIFSEHIGVSPKQYLKIIRFQSAIFQKQQNSNLTMTDLSYNSGYFDQSHFINDFKSLSGLTPKQYFTENEICSDFFE